MQSCLQKAHSLKRDNENVINSYLEVYNFNFSKVFNYNPHFFLQINPILTHYTPADTMFGDSDLHV